MIEFWAIYWVATRELLLLAAVGILVTGADDLFVDMSWLVIKLRRRFGRKSRPEAPPPEPAPLRFAVLLPAWQEADVIAATLARFTETMRWQDYDIFIGSYPNDPSTAAAIANVDDTRIVHVITRDHGPTTKADCLNALWRTALARESERGIAYDAFVLHDAEDVVHPDELSVFARHLAHAAMVQLPVIPFPDVQSRWVAGHYLDEFAESHAKELVVRQALGAPLPAAGVACAFSRASLMEVAAQRSGEPFALDSLTEDYELGLTITRRHAGVFVRLPASGRRAWVSTRENFPDTLEAAVRQKTRWLQGIALQGWDRLGWAGGAGAVYFLLRDRKAILNAAIILLGYTALLAVMGAAIAQWWSPALAAMPTLVEADSFLAGLLKLTFGLLLWRLIVRVGFTARHHGLAEGLRAIPRSVVANIVNLLAARRAVLRYSRVSRGLERITWDKTEHKLPVS